MDRDFDIMNLKKHELKAEILRLRNAIRRHRDADSDNRFFKNDDLLYDVLPEDGKIS